MAAPSHHEPDWVHGHPHDPNPAPPGDDASFTLVLPDKSTISFTVESLQKLPFTEIADCYIVSTGHGTSGPFRFGGVRLITLLNTVLAASQKWSHVDVISGDDFGARLSEAELRSEAIDRSSILAWQIDGETLTRRRGLVRLVVPGEVDDALKQVKWVSQIICS